MGEGYLSVTLVTLHAGSFSVTTLQHPLLVAFLLTSPTVPLGWSTASVRGGPAGNTWTYTERKPNDIL